MICFLRCRRGIFRRWKHPRPGFGYVNYPYYEGVGGTHLYYLGIAVIAATLPWIASQWRFSLRTMLITTTLVAVVLGLVVWATR